MHLRLRIFLLILGASLPVLIYLNRFNFLSPHPVDSPLLVYRAYLENRSGEHRVRILGISKCLNGEDNRRLEMNLRPDSAGWTHLHGRPAELRCPWEWAPLCKWNSYLFESNQTDSSSFPTEVALRWGSHTRRIPLIPALSLPRLQRNLVVCVPPLYWYNDWPRLLLFLQLWKEAERIILYVNSISADVRKVLDYYEKMGVVEVVAWPFLPSLPDEDPNASVYRLAHSLAHNDCLSRAASATFVALVDLDEFIFARNKSLFSVLEGILTERNSSIGSILFPHSGLLFRKNLDHSFAAASQAEAYAVRGPGKIIFMPSRTSLLLTHAVGEHLQPYKTAYIPASSALLIHLRDSFGEKRLGASLVISSSPLWPFSPSLTQRLRSLSTLIFNGTPPPYSSNVSHATIRCLSNWRKNCKTPLTSCSRDLLPLDHWIFSESTDHSSFTLI